jgi:hypothetical protein
MMYLRQVINALAIATMLGTTGTAVSATGTSGIGGTGTPAPHNGIGGTGKPRNGQDGIGGTGIIGTIEGGSDGSGIGGTGIQSASRTPGSIRVSGLTVRVTRQTTVGLLGNDSVEFTLAVGQLVMVEAPRAGQRLTARRIRVVHAVSGPISQINHRTGQLRILGQTVTLGKHTVLVTANGRRITLSGLKSGQHVRVSGLRNSENVIQATRISQAGAGKPVSLTGPVASISGSRIRIGSLNVNLGKSMPTGLATGSRVVIRGQLKNGQLVPVDIHLLPAVPFAGRYRRVILEGYASGKPGSNNLLRVSNLQVHVQGTTLVSGGILARDAHVRIVSRVSRNRLTAIRINIERPGPVNRRITTPLPRKAITGSPHHSERPEAGRHGRERPETEKPEVERPEAEKPETEKPEVERPEVEKPETEKPEVERPEVERPEVEKPEVERPEVERPEVEKPEVERPEVERPEVEKPEIERPET